jgi:BASS family bile acid:Na+ symporter
MQSSPLISIGLPISLFIIMIGIGMTLTPRDFRQVATYPRGIIVGTLTQILLMPALAFLLIPLFGLSPALAVGLVIIAACPGGTTSNLFALMARGNVALSIVLTVVANLITIISLPLLANLALGMYMDASEDIYLPLDRTIGTLVLIVLLPIAIGMGLKSRYPAQAHRAESAVSVFGGVVLAALVVAIVYGVRNEIGSLLTQAGPATVTLILLGIAVGLVAGRLAGLTQRESMAVAMELGIKNATIGLLITVNLIGSEAMSIPSAVYGVLMFFFGFLLILLGRRLIPQPQ